MELVVELSTGRVVLADVDQMDRFAVRPVPPPPGQPVDGDRRQVLGSALHEHGAGEVEADGDVLVPTAVVRRLAAEAAALGQGRPLGPEWETAFGAMLDFAASRGWMSGDAIRAHVDWGD
jgi:hypothetical protein